MGILYVKDCDSDTKGIGGIGVGIESLGVATGEGEGKWNDQCETQVPNVSKGYCRTPSFARRNTRGRGEEQ